MDQLSNLDDDEYLESAHLRTASELSTAGGNSLFHDPNGNDERYYQRNFEMHTNKGDNQFSLESFREELNNLTHSCENDDEKLEALFLEAKQLTATSAEKHHHQQFIEDQLAYVQAQQEATYQTPDHSFLGGLIEQTPGPPTPVKTPTRCSQDDSSPNILPNVVESMRQHDNLLRIDDERKTAFASKYYRYKQDKERDLTTQHEVHNHNDSSEEWKRLLEGLSHTVQIQEDRIHELELERDQLKEELRHERMHRYSNENDRLDENNRERFCSPGTKFVAELSQLINLPEDQCETLSHIMDKYYNRHMEYQKGRQQWH